MSAQNIQPRLFLIGAGVIANAHADGARSWDAALPILAADPSEAARTAIAQRVGAEVFPDAESLLASTPAQDHDVVVVAVPPVDHARYARLALESGRHVLCEKPLGLTAAEATEMLRFARERGRVFACCSSRFRGLPTNAEVRRLVQTNALGDDLHLTWMERENAARPGLEFQPASRWFLNRAVAGGGCLLDWGPYDVACWTEIFDVVRVRVPHAWTARVERSPRAPEGCVHDVESRALASLELELADGRIVRVTYERTSAVFGPKFSHFSLEGSRGAVEWDWRGYQSTVTLTHTGEADGALRTTQIEAPTPLPHLHARPIHYFLDRLAGCSAPGGIFDADAVFNFHVLCAIYEAARTGQPQTVERR